MNISDITATINDSFEREQLKKKLDQVLDFSFKIRQENIQLRGIASDISVYVNPDWKQGERQCPNIDVSVLEENRAKVEEDIQSVKKSMRGAQALGNNEELAKLEARLATLMKRKQALEAISSEGIVTDRLLGEYDGSADAVYLYVRNMSFDENEKKEQIIKTFIHEMFHAWSFHCRNRGGGIIREIEESMVEFATLYFLEQLSTGDPSFNEILKYAQELIADKQFAIGNTAAYGFGYYLYKQLQQSDNAILLLERYWKIAYRFNENDPKIQAIKKLLFPVYTFEKEEEIYDLFCRLILGNAQNLYSRHYTNTGQGATSPSYQRYYTQEWTPSDKKTNLMERNSGSRVLDQNVDAIDEISLSGNWEWSLFVILRNQSKSLYVGIPGKHLFVPLLADPIASIAVVDYGGEDSLVIKRASDCKIALIPVKSINDYVLGSLASPSFFQRDMKIEYSFEDMMLADDCEQKGLLAKRDGKLLFVFVPNASGVQFVEMFQEENALPFFFLSQIGDDILPYWAVCIHTGEKKYEVFYINGNKIFDAAPFDVPPFQTSYPIASVFLRGSCFILAHGFNPQSIV